VARVSVYDSVGIHEIIAVFFGKIIHLHKLAINFRAAAVAYLICQSLVSQITVL